MNKNCNCVAIIRVRYLLTIIVAFLIFIILGIQSCVSINSSTPSIMSATSSAYDYSSTQEGTSSFSGFTSNHLNTNDPKWLKGIPCLPPCWEGVTPGMTGLDDAKRIWNNLPVIRYETSQTIKFVGRESLLRVYYKIVGSPDELRMRAEAPIDPPDAPIQHISLQNFYGIKLEEVIDAFGQPSDLVVQIVPGNDTSSRRWFIYLIWMDLGLDLFSQGIEPVPEINNDLLIEQVNFYEPSLFGFYNAEFYNTGIAEIEGLMKPWHGYDVYSGYYGSQTPTP
jgi:hypothetical protein